MSNGGAGQALILVVERDPNIRALEEYFLQQAGFAVEFAKDGDEALARVRRDHPAILITEILVPRLDGLALCRAIKQDQETQRTAVLVFSILAAASRARDAGADAFLLKPLAERTLVDVVQRLLSGDGRDAGVSVTS